MKTILAAAVLLVFAATPGFPRRLFEGILRSDKECMNDTVSVVMRTNWMGKARIAEI